LIYKAYWDPKKLVIQMETGSETESVHEKKKILQYSENTGKIDD
jgi:hypothetical protein